MQRVPREFLGVFLPWETGLQDSRIDRLWQASGHIGLDDPRTAAVEACLTFR